MRTKKYFSILSTSLQSNLVYAKEVLIRSLFIVVMLYIFIELWGTVYGDSNSINGMTLKQVIWYLLISETIMLSKISIAKTLSLEVKEGTWAYSLTKPYNYLLYHLFNGLGNNILLVIINFFVGFVIVYLLVGTPPKGLYVLIPVALSTLLAFLIDFAIGCILGMLSFYTEDVSGYVLVYQKLLLVFGGLLIPLEFFPDWLKNIADMLPFRAILYMPANLFVNYSFDIFFSYITQQLGWLVVFVIILYCLEKSVLKKTVVNGG
ncbi:ABC transporter permease [Paenibacillus sp. T2-29]|uniref:ABC transporter permease n=1 Tax=Paenibacillus TaxID=44249 RepID=UPI0039BC77F1